MKDAACLALSQSLPFATESFTVPAAGLVVENKSWCKLSLNFHIEPGSIGAVRKQSTAEFVRLEPASNPEKKKG